MILPIPGRLAAQWFPANQLSTAMSLGIFGNQLGIALGLLLTPIIVKNRENVDDIGHDLSYLCWLVVAFTTIGFLLVLTCKFTVYCKRDFSLARLLKYFLRFNVMTNRISPLRCLMQNV